MTSYNALWLCNYVARLQIQLMLYKLIIQKRTGNFMKQKKHVKSIRYGNPLLEVV